MISYRIYVYKYGGKYQKEFNFIIINSLQKKKKTIKFIYKINYYDNKLLFYIKL